MAEQGLVNLNDPVEKFLPPSVKVPRFNGKKITLEDLAAHTSGLPEWPSNVWLNNTVGDINPNYSATQLYQALSDTKLTREPGAQVQYSSFGIRLLGHVLSLKSDDTPRIPTILADSGAFRSTAPDNAKICVCKFGFNSYQTR